MSVILDDGTNLYVYGRDLIASIDGAGVETYFTYDGLGSTADLTDDTATVTDTYSYDVFGDVSHDSGSSDNGWLHKHERVLMGVRPDSIDSNADSNVGGLRGARGVKLRRF